MKIFIVAISSGEYEDSETELVSVFDNRESAEKERGVIDTYYKNLKDKDFPYSEDDYMSESLTEEQEEEYRAVQSERWNADQYNCANIIELELNEPCITYNQK